MSATAGAPTITALRIGGMPAARAVGEPEGHHGETEVRTGQPGSSLPLDV